MILNIKAKTLLILITLLLVYPVYGQYKLRDIPYNINDINKRDYDGKQGLWFIFDRVDSTVFMMENFVNDTPNGYFERYWYNGKVSEKGFYKDGALDSSFTAYWEDGKKRGDLFYKKGLLNGIIISYDMNENIILRLKYTNGKRDEGYDLSYIDSSSIEDNYLYNKVDTVTKEFKYSDWNKQYAIYRNDSLIKEDDYFKNLLAIESFYERGILVKRIVYYRKDAQRRVEKVFYYLNGKLKKSEFYDKNGKLIKTVNAK